MQSHAKPYLFLLLAAAIGVVVCGGRIPTLPGPLSIRSPEAETPRAADAAMRQLLADLNENRWERLWDALPASYQRDVDDVLHLFAKRVPPDIWSRGVRITEASAGLMKTYYRQTKTSSGDSNDAERALSLAVTGTLAKALDSLSKSELSKPARLQSISCRSLVQAVGRNVIGPLRSVLLPTLPRDLRTIEVRLKETAGDSATVACTFPGGLLDDVEIELVRVEGKWVPRMLAEGWDERLRTLKAEINRERTDAERQEIVESLTEVERLLTAMTLSAGQGGDEETPPPSVMQALILAGYLIGGPPAIEPDFHKQTHKRLDEKHKTVLVMCYAPRELKWDNETVENDVVGHLAQRLASNKIQVVDPDRVRDWLEKHTDWEKAPEVGAALGADYIIHVDFKAYSLFEENSHDLYRGRADALVTVFEMDKNRKDGYVIYNKDLQSRFPTSGPVSKYAYPYAYFKKMYLSSLSQQIGALFYETFAGDDASDPAPSEVGQRAGAVSGSTSGSTGPSTAARHPRGPSMSNLDVIDLLRAGCSEHLIVALIRDRGGRFDRSRTALDELRNEGATEAILEEIARDPPAVDTRPRAGIESDFTERTKGRRLDEKGKKVAILCLSEPSARVEHPALDADIISELTRRFQTQKIKAIDSHRIANWLDDHQLDESSDLAEIGREFGVDFIVLVKFDDFGFHEGGSRDLYGGHAYGKLAVVELTDNGSKSTSSAKRIYDKPFDFTYDTIYSSDGMTLASFQRKFLDRLSRHLAEKLCDHSLGEEP